MTPRWLASIFTKRNKFTLFEFNKTPEGWTLEVNGLLIVLAIYLALCLYEWVAL